MEKQASKPEWKPDGKPEGKPDWNRDVISDPEVHALAKDGTYIICNACRRQGRKNAKVLMRHPVTIGRWKEHKAYKGNKEAMAFIQWEESQTTKRQRATQSGIGSFFSKKSKTMCNKDSKPSVTANMKST